MADSLHPALLYTSLDDGRVRCQLCHHRCTLGDGDWGICGARTVRGGSLCSAVYGKAVAQNADPIEKKPLFHFYPGTRSFSIATFGCNFSCRFCQNWNISQVRRAARSLPTLLPEEVVRRAAAAGCRSVSFTYSEPTIFFEYAYDTAVLARERGIDTVFVTNGFMSPEALAMVAPVLGGANVDLKCFRDETYRRMTGGALAPVLDTLRDMVSRGIWVEVTTLVIPGMNDSPGELADIAGFVAKELGPEVPWHVSRFHPDHELTDRPATPVGTLLRARQIGQEAGLRYVFTGNLPGEEGESTVCHGCGATLIARWGFRILKNRLRDGACPDCGTEIAGVGMRGEP